MRRALLLLVALVAIVGAAWGALALHFAGPHPPFVSNGLALALILMVVAILARGRPIGLAIVALVAVFALVAVWWSSLEPRNDRNWQRDVANLPHLEQIGDLLTVTNLRDFTYRSETDFTPRWETRVFDLTKLAGLDLFMSYWGSPLVAHTILSWDFGEGKHLAISIETRKEKGEEYSAIAGSFKQYELYYVVADEADVIGLRTNYRKEQVYLYLLRTPIERAKQILLDYAASINALQEKPEFYNAATASCTTTITAHARNIGVTLPRDWRVLVNGHLDELLYEQQVIDVTRPFAELRQASLVNARAEATDRSRPFSERIREGLIRPPLLVLPTPD
jgi:hypothetical protein